MSNSYVVAPTSSREDGHYENIVRVGDARDGLCHEITIPFVHHTIEVDLSVRPPGSRPHSASTRYDHVTRTFGVMESREYLTLTKCQPCDSRLALLRTRRLNCVSTLRAVCRISIPKREFAEHVLPVLEHVGSCRHHRTWQLDRVRASALPHDLVPNRRRYVSCACIA